MIWRVEVRDKKGVFDALGESVKKDILDLGISSVSKVEVSQVYLLDGQISELQVVKICQELLVDQIVQDYYHTPQQTLLIAPAQPNLRIVEIAYNPGVMDPVEESTLKGIRDLGIETVSSIRTSKKYLIYGKLSDQEFNMVVDKILSNKLIQHVVDHENLSGKKRAQDTETDAQKNAPLKIVLVNITKASDKELLSLSQQGQLFLNLEEMKAIQKYFKKEGRDPTDCELETIAQTWSEHCCHKTFRGDIRYHTYEKGKKRSKKISNLLKSTIIKATKEINKSWCVSVFHDNAGVIKFDDDSNVCFKVETHNHPSALEPFGGANTGIGGVIRDTLGTGLGAKPICNTDIFCFGRPEVDFQDLPAGTLHPGRVMKGVISGVRDYGNKMGIPTANGAIVFDSGFIGNPLVFCGNVGLIPKDKVNKTVHKGDWIMVVGGRTGRDGIHGATFSSGELTDESEVISCAAVQIGNPIQEKKVTDALMKARDQGLYSAITDCGAGGLSSAVGEMGQDLGCRVDLEKVPVKYQGLNYHEIWISESQERMVLAVHPDSCAKLLEVFASENVEATVIGEFTDTKRLELFYEGCQVGNIAMEFLHHGIPKITKEAVFAAPKLKAPRVVCPRNLTEKLLEVLSHYNVCSKEWVIRQYDHEVQGSSVLKPLVGVHGDAPSDAAVLRPKLNLSKGIAVSNGINIRFGMIDPFWMAASCIDEAIRQIIVVGGNLDQIAILDNFCWGNPDKPDRLGRLVRAAQGCYQTAVGYQVPFISGKDSLYNEYTLKQSGNGKHKKKNRKGSQSLAIPGTLLISAIGIIEDIHRVVSMDFKRPGNSIYILGETFDELGGSIYLDTYGLLGNTVAQVDTKSGTKIFRQLSEAIQKGLIASAHDCSEGGLAVTLAEMAWGGDLGITVLLDKVPYRVRRDGAVSEKASKRNDTILFSESNSRFVVEVPPEAKQEFEKILKGAACAEIGRVEESPEFIIYGLNEEICINAYIGDLKEAWKKTLAFA